MLLICALTACTPERVELPSSTGNDTKHPTDTSSTVTEPNIPKDFPFTFSVDDADDITIKLPRDPALWAELHLLALDGTDSLNRVILHTVDDELEEARVFDGMTGNEIFVTPIKDILARFVSTEDDGTHWSIRIGGADFRISKDQFTDSAEEDFLTLPDFTRRCDYFVEHGVHFCRVRPMCTSQENGFANETLLIRYGFENGVVIPAEITFERPKEPIEKP